jgi:hypothetical protein
MQKKPELFLKRYARPLLVGAFSGLIFLSCAQHLFRFWELPALLMLFLFALIVPVIAWVVSLLITKFSPHLNQIKRSRLGLLALAAILIGLFVAWRVYQAPSDFQTITITPLISKGQAIDLLELKADGHVVKMGQAALESGWQEKGGAVFANSESGPLTLSFKRRINTPVTLLFGRSPHTGVVRIEFENERIESDLRGTDGGHMTINFFTRYRGLPNWLFVPLMVLADTAAFGALVLVLLLLQEIGERSTLESTVRDERFPSHRAGLATLLGLGLILHLTSALTTPLLLYADSPAYLQGAAHWLQFGNLDGVPVFRGPGTTLIFAPILWLFGRNLWGMKIFLHLIALACIPLSYRLGWQLSGKRWLAFIGGLFVALTPDMYLYSNFVMSDLINLFLVLVFCTLLISALQDPGFRNVLAALLTASLATLVRSENLVLLALAFLVLGPPPAYAWLRAVLARQRDDQRKHLALLGWTALAFGIAALPLFWWSLVHYKLHGFLSVGNHSGVVLYDGWVYYGDASKLSFSDPDSPAIQKIDAAMSEYSVAISDRTGAPTSLELYPALRAAGYSDYEIFELLEQAAWDSIRKDPPLTLKLLFIKLEASLVPEIPNTVTYTLPGEPAWENPTNLEFFDMENLSIPPLIRMQRVVNETVNSWYPRLYPWWVLLCVLALTLSLFRSPARMWIVLVLIVASRIFIPAVMALSSWRYTLSGWIPFQIIAVSWLLILTLGIKQVFAIKPSSELP